MNDKINKPITSIIVPCLNEQGTIHLLLDALFEQSYPHEDMEVVIADGGSTDGTQAVIQQWSLDHPDLKLKVVENPAKKIPSALNTAIKASSGEIIIRLDAHSEPHQEYVQRVVAALKEDRGDNVGGVWHIKPGGNHWVARAIAAAAGHPIGVGGALYRYTDKAAYVDTVPFGGFKRELLKKIGMFDETLLTNEDYEFNARILQNGGKIWLDPAIHAVYYARKNLSALARQYWRYGYWKWHMLRRYPKTLRLRQALPPLFILSLILLLLSTPFIPLAFYLLIGLLGIYFVILFITGVHLALKEKEPTLILGVPLAIVCMHFSWGTGFIWGVLNPQKQNRR